MSNSAPASRPIRLAISTCPNDTFAFHAILNRKIDLRGLEFEISLLDIQQLNDGLFADQFDVAKSSFHAAILLAENWVVLPSGSALGFGVGPLLLSANSETRPDQSLSGHPSLTLCPGKQTTATLLFKLFYGRALASGITRLEQRVFSDIMPSLQTKTADFGVCIHEGRFTWEQEGLFLVEDLGTRWEKETDSPLPLGGIVARKDLGQQTIENVQNVIQQSIQYGLEHRNETLPTMRSYAQEFSDEVLMSHVDLYVNQWTIELGAVGRQALDKLAGKAHECGVADGVVGKLNVWKPN